MLIEEAIYKILKTATPVTDLVVGRIFAGKIPQQNHTWPALCYGPPSDGRREPVRTLQGGVTLVKQRIQVFSAAQTMGRASELDIAICTTLDEFSGTVVDELTSPEESIDIQAIYLVPPGEGIAHGHQWVDKTQLHEFLSEYDCHFIDPTRITES